MNGSVAVLVILLATPGFSADTSICASSDGCVVMDVDVGGDDAMSISMVMGSPKVKNLVAITTTAGNTGVNNATRNVLYLLNFFNRSKQVEVAKGTDDALAGPLHPSFYYGYDGFGDFLPPNKNPAEPTTKTPAALYLAQIVNSYPGKVTAIFLGPLTNLALALHLNTNFIDQVKQVIILGGSYMGLGNVKPGAESNFFEDPEAASYIFNKTSGYNNKVYLVPMEAVRNATFSMKYRKEELGQLKSKTMKLLNQVERVGLKNDGMTWPPYDMSATSIYLDPAIVTSTLDTFIKVETGGRITRGVVLTDFDNLLRQPPNVKIIKTINQTMLSDMLFKFLS